jgi:predicted NUDIX family phosphoesterase
MNDYFEIEFPLKHTVKVSDKLTREKTSLYIPTRIRNKIKFKRSQYFKNVFVNHEVRSILKAIVLHGKIKHRYTVGKKKGLEEDVSKQQIIFYTVVIDQGYILMYSRAQEGGNTGGQVNVEPRLEGRFSIGFGGHTSDKDQFEVNLLIESFKDLIPALFPEIALVMSTNKARINELFEELGLEPDDFKWIKPVGTFYVKDLPQAHKQKKQVSVQDVHTAICAIAEVNGNTIGNRKLKLPKSEFGGAQWVKIKDLSKTFAKIEKAGGQVEEWSKIVAKEYLSEAI